MGSVDTLLDTMNVCKFEVRWEITSTKVKITECLL